MTGCHTDGNRDRVADASYRHCLNHQPQLFGNLDGLGRRGIGQRHNKFLAAESRHQIRATNGAFQAFGHLDQALITNVVTIAVVDGFEMINVEQQQAQSFVVLTLLIHQPPHGIGETASVQQARQRIAVGQIDQLLIEVTGTLEKRQAKIATGNNTKNHPETTRQCFGGDPGFTRQVHHSRTGDHHGHDAQHQHRRGRQRLDTAPQQRSSHRHQWQQAPELAVHTTGDQ